MTVDQNIKDLVTQVNIHREELRRHCAIDVIKNISSAIKESKNKEYKKAMAMLLEKMERYSTVRMLEFKYGYVERNAEKIKDTIIKTREEIITATNSITKQVIINSSKLDNPAYTSMYDSEIKAILNDVKSGKYDSLITRVGDLYKKANASADKKVATLKHILESVVNKVIEFKFYEKLYVIFKQPDTEYLNIVRTCAQRFKEFEQEVDNLPKDNFSNTKKNAEKILDKIELLVQLSPDGVNLAPSRTQNI